jgi:hypothetical protein
VQVTDGIDPIAQEASRLIFRRSAKMSGNAKLKMAISEGKLFGPQPLLKKAHAVM